MRGKNSLKLPSWAIAGADPGHLEEGTQGGGEKTDTRSGQGPALERVGVDLRLSFPKAIWKYKNPRGPLRASEATPRKQ